MPRIKHIEIPEQLHDLIKFFCFCNRIKMKDFVTNLINDNPELKAFEKQRKKLKFS